MFIVKHPLAWLAPLALVAHSVAAEPFTLRSADIAHGEFMNKAQEFAGFGCNGANRSPQLSWSGAPAGTQAFAVFAYDPDAPTGSGWWHWQLVNIPSTVTSLPSGAGDAEQPRAPKGSQHTRNDYGVAGFGGACPPEGHGAHRYQFTVFALSQPLELPAGASAALTGYMVKAHALGSASLEALYKR
ncbi:YbhB/YbcL family Raf kinase inhibitor-like protein [Atopomonas sediminilitoris]|uniref:YbhB/YbcL family Raf kinase inhibitor-like protein n=1 Tax=Atopomonas sediminilitoris TaxID=2919919 RepID=UPI001F4EE84C|nr:YbhB/YbcL family Raf kinase inhibitor-like protein [Atopomonas sediminilitoris]MCJ8169310.1 YbhB/YbcL family Raf kinase inhibitor-like protein [Atopomonas sediminilitoris]